MTTVTQEQQALLANAVRVLVDELNSKMDEAAQLGLRVHLSVPTEFYVRETRNAQHVAVRIFQEVL